MVMTALKAIDPGFPSESDRLAALEASRALSKLSGRGCVRVEAVANQEEKQTFVLPAEAVRLLTDMLAQLGEGRPVVVMPKDVELTTQDAANMLNVSRPYIISLIERGQIKHRMVGTHRRILLDDLLAYKAKRDDVGRSALDALAEEAQELDMGY